MKKNSISLSISTPCSESWDQMHPLQSGKYCDRCSKTVTDFSSFSDQQLIDLFSSHNGRMCGRLREDQMQRMLVPEKQNERHSFIKPALAGISLLLSFTIGKSQNITEKPPHVLKTSIISYYAHQYGGDDGPGAVCGHILDSISNVPLMDAIINVQRTSFTCTSDTNGWFNITLPSTFEMDSLVLEISCEGYIPKNVTVTTDTPMYATLEPVTIRMEDNTTPLFFGSIASASAIDNQPGIKSFFRRLRHPFWKLRHRNK